MRTKALSTAKRVQPRFIEPMHAEAVSKLPEGDDCSYKPKLDGYHCLAAKSTDRVVLWSRRENLFTGRFPEIACENLPLNTLIHGESLVSTSGNSRRSASYKPKVLDSA